MLFSRHFIPALVSVVFGIVAFVAAAGLAVAYVGPGGAAPGGQADQPLNTGGGDQVMNDLGIKVAPAGLNGFAVKNSAHMNGFYSVGNVVVDGDADASHSLPATGKVVVNGDLVVSGPPHVSSGAHIWDKSFGTSAPNTLRPVCANQSGELVICGEDDGERRVHDCFYWSELSSSEQTLGPAAPGAPVVTLDHASNYNYLLSCHYQDTLGDDLDPTNLEIEHINFNSNSGWQTYNTGTVANGLRFGNRLAIIPGLQGYRMTTPAYWDQVSSGGAIAPEAQVGSIFHSLNYGALSGMTIADFDQFSLTGGMGSYTISSDIPEGTLENHVWRVRVSDGAGTFGPWVYLHTNELAGSVWAPGADETDLVLFAPGQTSIGLRWTLTTQQRNMLNAYYDAFPSGVTQYVVLRCDPDDLVSLPGTVLESDAPCAPAVGAGYDTPPTWGRVIDVQTFTGNNITQTFNNSLVAGTVDSFVDTTVTKTDGTQVKYFWGVVLDGPTPQVGDTYGEFGGPTGSLPFDYSYFDNDGENLKILGY